MMRWVFALILAGPAYAQSAPLMTANGCQQSYERLGALTPGEVTQETLPKISGDGWCIVEGLRFPFDTYVVVRFDELRWRVADPGRLDQSLPPTAISLRANGISFVPSVREPVMDYLFEVQAGRTSVDAVLDVGWNAANQTVTLTQARIDFEGDNSIFASGVLRNVDMSDAAKLQLSLGQMALTDLTLEIESNGLFENYMAMAVGAALLEGSDDPAADVERLKTAGQELLRTIPTRILDGPSSDALSRLIADMPHPSGVLELQFQSETGVGALSLAPAALAWSNEVVDEVWSFLPELTIEARYSRSSP